jgi:adenosine deaminase
VTDNLLACRNALDLSLDEIVRLARNGLEAAFVAGEERHSLLMRLDTYLIQHADVLARSPAD